MVPAVELQERLSPEYSIRYVQTEIENHPKKVIFLTWEELNRLKDYQIPKDNSIWNVCPGCFPVLLLYQSALFRCSQPEK